MIIGRNMGHAEPGMRLVKYCAKPSYCHNVGSWESLWKQVGREIGAAFDVQTWERSLQPHTLRDLRDDQYLKLYFVVTRL